MNEACTRFNTGDTPVPPGSVPFRDGAHEMKRVIFATGLLFVLLSIVAGTMAVLWPYIAIYTIPLHQHPGRFDRSHFESVVAQVRGMELAPNTDHDLRLDDLNNPQSLRPVRANEIFYRGQAAGGVCARIDSQGKLKVVIVTKDLGHAGIYGFAYSDEPLAPQPDYGAWQTLDVPSHVQYVLPNMKIDDHWWKVEYNLD